MKDYQNMSYARVNFLDLMLLRGLLWWHRFEVENYRSLVVRIQDEVHRGVAQYDELLAYKMELVRHQNRAREIAQKIEVAR